MNRSSHKILTEYQKFVVESRLIDVPLLLLVRLHDEHPRTLASISCVDVEIYAAIRLAERHFYQTLSLLCHSLNLLFYAKVHLLDDLSKWHNRRMKWYR